MKFSVFLAACVSLVLYSIVSPPQINLDEYFNGEYTFYSTEYIESPLFTQINDTGFSYIYHCDSSDAPYLRKLFSKLDGESVTIDDIPNVHAFLENIGARTVSTSGIGDMNIIYAYTPKIPTFITNNGKKINIQIASQGGQTTIGWPVILGSY